MLWVVVDWGVWTAPVLVVVLLVSARCSYVAPWPHFPEGIFLVRGS